MSREPEQDGWLGSTLRQSPAAPTTACLDAETLAAWADGGLNAQAAAAAEVHASTCPRCLAVLAAMERATPAPSARHGWAPARLFRWLVPLAAAATAIAIWVAVPDRPITPQQSAAVRDLGAAGERADAPKLEEVPVPVPEERALEPSPSFSPETRNPAPSTQNPEPQQQSLLRDESRRERAAAESPPVSLGGAAVADAPAAAPQAPAAPSAAARSAPSTDTLAETARSAQGSAFKLGGPPSESTAPSNPLVRWRVIGPASIERSTDGGKIWTRSTPLPGVTPDNTAAISVVAIRAVDGDRAVVSRSDGAELYTTDGGRSWTRVQENSKAPF